MSYSIARTNVIAALATGLIALSAASALATPQRSSAARSLSSARTRSTAGTQASARSQTSRASSRSGGNGGVGLGAPASTKAQLSGNGGAHHVLHLGDRTLREGMTGRDVRVLQDYLSRVGYSTIVDGDFGPATGRNVRAFERAIGRRADGVVTLAVANALRAAVAKAQKTNSGPVGRGHLNSDGTASPPANAPTTIKRLFAAANKIATKPYIYGGGHASWNDSGYDCSGSLSYALHGANLLDTTMDSTEFESYGSRGPGRWISIWSNSGHTYMYVAGLRYDTSAQDSTGGSRWTDQSRSNSGFVETHPTGW